LLKKQFCSKAELWSLRIAPSLKAQGHCNFALYIYVFLRSQAHADVDELVKACLIVTQRMHVYSTRV